MELKVKEIKIDDDYASKFFVNGQYLNEFIYLTKTQSVEKENRMTLKTHGKGPINIALIKYWGKEDEKEIIPLNNSISVTLDMDNFYTDTYAELILDDKSNQELFLNGEKDKISSRVEKIIRFLRESAEDLVFEKTCDAESLEIPKEKLKSGSLRIISRNTFPTAAGCASSASSMAVLVKVISCLFNFKSNQADAKDLSALARLGSGSACRSIYGGFSEWIAKLPVDNGFRSVAVSIANESLWTQFNISLLVVSHKKKDKGSTDGMKLSKETSEFLKFRVEKILPQRLLKMREAILSKDFETVAEFTMRDSNNFHAVCRDTFPTINYLNETSEFVIKCVENLNNLFTNNDESISKLVKKNFVKKFICAYSFDAGPNAFIFYLDEDSELVRLFFGNMFELDKKEDDPIALLNKIIEEYVSKYFEFDNYKENKQKVVENLQEKFERIYVKLLQERKDNKYNISEINNFKAGKGAHLVKHT